MTIDSTDVKDASPKDFKFLSVFYSNVDTGLLNKKTEFLSRISDIKPDIIALTEIYSKNKDSQPLDSEFEIPGYDMFRNDYKKRGVVLYITKQLNAERCNLFDNYQYEESVWSSFKSAGGEKILIGCIYRSPNSETANTDCLFELLKSQQLKSFNKVCIVGDFNFPNIDWKGTWNGNKNNIYLENFRDAYLFQKVENCTRHRVGQRSTLDDLILVNDDSLMSNVTHLPPLGKSDHDVLTFELYIKRTKEKQHVNYKYNLSKGDYANFRTYINNESFSHNPVTVEDLWIEFKTKITTGMDKFIPRVKLKSNLKPRPNWMDNKVLRKIKKKHGCYKRFMVTKAGLDYQRFINERNDCNRVILNAKIKNERTIANECKRNPKKFWKYVQKQTKGVQGVTVLKRKDGTTATTNEEKANILNSFFASVFSKEDLTNMPDLKESFYSKGFSISDLRITPNAVKQKLQSLDPNKAQGPDGIPSRVLKELSNEIALPLCNIFNLSIETSRLPEDWKNAEVTAIFKKGSRSEPGNYRPVSLTSICCKVLESLVRDVIVDYFDKNNLYADCQHGFRKKRSCVTQLIEVIEDFTYLMDEGSPLDVLYLDFRKAFDTVPHERLLCKLRAYGVTGTILKWIENFLKDRTQYVKIMDSISNTEKVLSGIPQGSVLGPILFTIFINDLPDSIQSFCKVFADDTKIYNTSVNCTTMQQDIYSLQEWSEKWNLYFNVDKCKVLHIGRNNPCLDYIMNVNDSTCKVKECKEEKDLGVTFDDNLSFDNHINNCINMANKMIGLIRRSFSFLDKDIFCKLYKALVRPHVEYANSVWHPYLKRQSAAIEKIQRRATKLVRECSDLPYHDRIKFLNIHSLKGRRLRGDLILVFKIYNKLVDLNWSDLFQEPLYNKTRESEGKLFIRHSVTNKRKFCFTNRVATLWNTLPLTIKKANSIDAFKNALDKQPNMLELLYDFDE